MKKVLKWVGILLLIPILLFLLLTLLLYLPPVQNWAVGHVAEYASEQTGMDISVGHVSLKFPLDLQIDDFQAIKDNDSIPGLRDTIAKVEKLTVDVRLKPLFKKVIEIDGLEMTNADINTDGLVADARVKGKVGRLALQSHGINLKEETLRLDNAEIEGAILDVALADTVPPDTTESDNHWKVFAENLKVTDSGITLHMPGDTLNVEAWMGSMTAQDGRFDLGTGEYNIGHADWKGGSLKYDNRFEKAVDGLDSNHIHLTDVNLAVDSVSYLSPHLDLRLQTCQFKEKSGLQVDQFSGRVMLDSARVSVSDAYLRTPDSKLSASIEMDLNAFDDKHPGLFYTDLEATIGKQDMMRLVGGLPQQVKRQWPNQPMTVSGRVRGNMQRADFNGLHVEWPSALSMHADGYVERLNDPDHLKAQVRMRGKTGNLDFVKGMLDPQLAKTINIPQGIAIDGDFGADGKRYAADFKASEGGGSMKADLKFNADNMSYHAKVDAVKFPVQHFVKGMNLSPLTANIEADGQGTDFLSPKTKLKAKARVTDFKYDKWQLNGITADATLNNGHLLADINSHNQLLNGHVAFDAAVNTNLLDGKFTFDVNNADLYTLRISDTPLTVSGSGHLDINSDMKESYKAKGMMQNVSLTYKNTLYRPDDITLDILTQPDTTYAHVDCSDFHLNMNGSGGYKKLTEQATHFADELMAQVKERKFDEKKLRDRLPEASLYLTSGHDNFFADLLEEEGYSFDHVLIDMQSSPWGGLNGEIKVDSLQASGYQLDAVRFDVNTDDEGFKFSGQVQNGPDNPQYVFNSLIDGEIRDGEAFADLKLYDAKQRLGVDVGLSAVVVPEGVRMRLTNTTPVLGYIPFHANEDNYIFLADDKRVSAKLNLVADEGMRVQVYTNDDNEEALQDLTVSVEKLDINRIISVFPYLPDVKGIADGDFHIVQTPTEVSISSDLSVKDLYYEGTRMGNLSSEFVYMPNEDGSHFIDGILYSDGTEAGTLTGSYKPDNGGTIDADFSLSRTPLSLLNGFIPDHILGFMGYATGSMSIKGPLSKPAVNGEITPDSAYFYSSPYGIKMRMEEQPLRIVGNHLNFKDYKIFSTNNSPLTVNGSLDFSNLDRMFLDLSMRARDFLLINAKEQPNSEAYGKAYVNFFSRINGPLDALSMRGRLDVLGSTDMTYILRDSPITTDNRLDELVKFVDFNDSTQQTVTRPPLTGFTMDLTMKIDEAAQIKCDLNADHSNYIDLIGGGELRMMYNAIDNLRLTGHYTLSNGEMKYSLPIIPLKTFVIQDGSYIEFTGDPMNPTLNITALERTKATVAEEGGGTRSVDFNCGVVLTQTLNDMGLEFIVNATDDVTIASELSAMSKEERGKVAVTMLTTGMYLADGNTSGFTMNGALSSFLQAEINNLTGNALRSLNLSVGVDNATDASGNMHTDYSFKFAKRFWNNRLSITVGGKLSTGSEVEEQNQSFFSNVSFEYRLSPTSNKYLKLYYDRDAYDWLEGEIGEYGGGFLWRRKLDHFMDVFKWKTQTPAMPSRMQPRDSLRMQPRDSLRMQPRDSLRMQPRDTLQRHQRDTIQTVTTHE